MSSSSSNEIIGRCLCGEIKIKTAHECSTDKSYQIVLCHCINCHRAGDTKSKSVSERYFCRQCGSPVYSKSPETKPKKIIIQLSLFIGEIDQLPRPMKELFCKEMMDWEKKIDGAEHYDERME
ncbi:unnamed protein product [Rotaria sp. Silwood1]|nr:unnamed protein product [Rotaria sp. Silwood1]CAF1470751.1 unnamed protein product [Rotaria sp. Silwood1]CAF3549552.1 unnamed protein product [Rotaria sp. Silwood1]CAF3611511.1 unnamed protein product [Rotaria sp. Silwood1]CAF3687347.1 unnamed protein product [Rotaria sp. Silwood1]